MKRINEESYSDPRESYEQLLSVADEEVKSRIEETWKENGGDNTEADYETLRNAYIEAERVWKEYEKLKAREEMTDNMKDTFIASENKIPTFDIFEQESEESYTEESEEGEKEESTRTDIAGADERSETRQAKLEAITRLSDGLPYVRTLTTAENLDRLSDRALDELYQLIKNAKAIKEAVVEVYEGELIIKGDDGKETRLKIDGSIEAVEEEEDDYQMGKTPQPAPGDEIKMDAGEALGEEYEEDQKILTKLVNLVQQNDIVMVFAPNRHVKHIVIDDVTDINMVEGTIFGLTEDGEEIQFYPQDIEFIDLPGNKRLSFNDLTESVGKIGTFDFYFGS